MRFEEALSAMRAGRVVRVPAVPTGNSEYFYRICEVPPNLPSRWPMVGVCREANGSFTVCNIGSATLLREDFDLVPPEEIAPQPAPYAACSVCHGAIPEGVRVRPHGHTALCAEVARRRATEAAAAVVRTLSAEVNTDVGADIAYALRKALDYAAEKIERT